MIEPIGVCSLFPFFGFRVHLYSVRYRFVHLGSYKLIVVLFKQSNFSFMGLNVVGYVSAVNGRWKICLYLFIWAIVLYKLYRR